MEPLIYRKKNFFMELTLLRKLNFYFKKIENDIDTTLHIFNIFKMKEEKMIKMGNMRYFLHLNF